MALTLEQYAADYLPKRGLPWPAAPRRSAPPKARPQSETLDVKAVLWNVYGTLLAIPHGEFRFEHDPQFVTDIALRKTLDEFKMWQSMSRKPGAPEEYLRELVQRKLTRSSRWPAAAGESIPRCGRARLGRHRQETAEEGIQVRRWLSTAPMNEYVKKIAYFYHASIQGTGRLSQRGGCAAQRRGQRPRQWLARGRSVLHAGSDSQSDAASRIPTST